MSTPDRSVLTPEPSTPGWGTALFGFLSTTKKKPQPSSTGTADSTGGNRSAKHPPRVDFGLQPVSSPGFASPTNNDIFRNVATTDDSQDTNQTGVSFMNPTASLTTKSSWKSPGRNSARFSKGRPARRTSSLRSRAVVGFQKRAATKTSVTFKTKFKTHWKPSSATLNKKTSLFDAHSALQSLQQVETTISRPIIEGESRKQNLSSFKATSGIRLLGSNQTGGSRLAAILPQEPAKTAMAIAATSAQTSYEQGPSSSSYAASDPNALGGEPGNKRARKVTFDGRSSAAVAGPSAYPAFGTPAAKSFDQTPSKKSMPLSSTPFKPRTTDDASPMINSIFSPLPPKQMPLQGSMVISGAEKLSEPETEAARRWLYGSVNSELGVADELDTRSPSFLQSEYDAEVEKARLKTLAKDASESASQTYNIFNTNDSQNHDAKRTRAGDVSEWQCTHEVDGEECGSMNPGDESRCLSCNAGRKAAGAESGGWGTLFANLNAGKWKCYVCGVYNPPMAKCQACEADKGTDGPFKPDQGKDAKAQKPAAPAADNSSSISKLTSSSGASRTAPPPAPSLPGAIGAGGFSFGGASSSNTGSSVPAVTGISASATSTAPPSGGFSFGTAAPAPTAASKTTASGSGFSFGAAPAKSTSETLLSQPSGGFSFSTSATQTSGAETATPVTGFQFGAAPPASLDPPKFGFSMGASAKTVDESNNKTDDTPAKPSFSFGGSSKTPQASTDSKRPTFQFSSTPAPTKADDDDDALTPPPPPPGGLVAQRSFGGAPKTEPKPKRSRDTSDDNAQPASASKATKPTFSFGSGGAASSFGASSATDGKAAESQSSGAPVFSFGGTKPSGDAGSNTAATGSSGLSFGGTKLSGNASSSMGAQASASSGFSFGGTNAAPAPVVPLGSIPSGAQEDGSTKRQRSGASQPPNTAAQFGSTPSPAPASLFGKAPAPAPAGSFGNGQAAPSFSFGGSQSSTAQSTTPAPSATSTSMFGSAPLAAAPPATDSMPVFSFGSSAPSSQAPAPSGSFGSAPDSSQTAFGFGQSSQSSAASTPAPAAPGFTFGGTAAPTPAPPAFGATPAPAADMFGNTPTAPAAAFGSAPPPSTGMFGSAPAPAPGAPAFSFGSSAPAPAAPMGGFGAAPPAANNPFGAGPPPMAATPTPAFGFGSAAPTTPAPAFGGGGGFGATPVSAVPNSFGQAPPSFGGGATPGGFGTPAASDAPVQFSMGTAARTQRTPGTARRRIVKARRPGGTRPA